MALHAIAMNAKRLTWGLVAISAALFVARWYAAGTVGFGDSEALYASYALHPQPAYLDHPGLIGMLARMLGRPPTPVAAHHATAILATLVPWAAALAARGLGATWRGALLAGITFAVTPEIAVGLFGMTPDLPLAFAWLGALGAAGAGLRAAPGSARAAGLLLLAGLLAGIGAAAKVSSLLLVVSLAAAYATRAARAHAKTVWPWAGLLAGILVVLPVVMFEAKTGWPMVQHRLVDTQIEAGMSWRNLAAVPLGQLVYVSPLLVVAAVIVARDLWRRRRDDRDDAPTALLFFATFVPLAVLVPLALWSRVAEPHWIGPALLALPLHFARRADAAIVGRRLGVTAIASALFLVAVVHAWVLVPAMVKLVPEGSYDARYDIANELYGWPKVIERVKETLAEEQTPTDEPGDIVVVGPHWIVCGQLEAGLAGHAPVGCATPIRDDFDDWYPRPLWRRAETILFVSDARFDMDPASISRAHTIARAAQPVVVKRGGRVVRTFTVTVLTRRGSG